MGIKLPPRQVWTLAEPELAAATKDLLHTAVG
jgi:hypothetical protein